MAWSQVIGQERVKHTLRSALAQDRLPHALLFHGNEGVGKDAMAIELARVIHCERGTDEACGACGSCVRMRSLQHPDVRLVFAMPVGKGEKNDDDPTAKLGEQDITAIREELQRKAADPYHRIAVPRATVIKINSIREIRRTSSMSPGGSKRKIYIIANADDMGEPAANTLLKTLEEPARNTMLILTTARREALLPTIVSRCQPVRFDPLTEEEIRAALVERASADPTAATLAARLSNGNFGRAVALLGEDFGSMRDDVVAFVKHSVAGHPVEVCAIVESFSGAKDRDAVARFLHFMLIWFRDALVLPHGGELVNADQITELRSFVAKLPRADVAGVIREVEHALSLVDRNVYITLILLRLSTVLRQRILPSA